MKPGGFDARRPDAAEPLPELLRDARRLLLAVEDRAEPRGASGEIHGKRPGDHLQLKDRAESLSQGGDYGNYWIGMG